MKTCRYLQWLTAAALLLGLSGCSQDTVKGPRFETSQLNSEFRMAGAPFSEYIEHTRTVIGKTRQDLTLATQEKIIAANSPFEWKPEPAKCPAKSGRLRNGILLIHGLTDSPLQMHDVGRHFLEKCFLVRAILLPGHGTVPGDLLEIEYGEWIKAAKYGIDSFKGQVDNTYIGGFSTGGALAIYHAMNGEDLKALILFSPAVKISSNMGFMANWHKVASWAKTDMRWMDVTGDEDYAKYESFTYNAADQIYLLTREITRMRSALDLKVSVPIFAALSAYDATVDAGSTVEFFKEQTHRDSVMLLYTNGRGAMKDKRIQAINSAHPEKGILNYAHLSIHLSSANPHYGARGDYVNCLHYISNKAALEKCKAGGAEIRYGEVTDANLEKYTVRRLTYNPEFGQMLERLDGFLKKIDSASR